MSEKKRHLRLVGPDERAPVAPGQARLFDLSEIRRGVWRWPLSDSTNLGKEDVESEESR